MWGMVEKLGFRGGRVIEPSAGTGLFFGLRPDTLAARSDFVGGELDRLIGGILQKLYPGARILVPTEKQRTASNRRLLLSQIATGDWDAVITPHGFFNSVSVSPSTEQAFIENQLAECEEALEASQQNSDEGSRLTVKNIRRRIKTLKARLEKQGNSAKDENIFFEDLGIDALLIDEAHAYKRGSFFTKMDNVKGLDRDASQRSMQLLMKARHVQEKTGGKNVILATGTPISNTLTELWTMFRYIRPDLLKSFNVTQFDDFASTFADTSMSLEETATGDFRMIERFNTYTNGQDLLNMWRCGADIALIEDMNYLNGVPRLQGSKIQDVAVERSESLTNYIRALKAERDDWDRQPASEKMAHPSVPLEIYGKAKRAAIDLRLIASDLPDISESKANKAVENILETWKEHSDTRAAQLVFCDSFQSSDKNFNLFEDIKAKLIAEGVPEQEIAIIHDFQTDKARSELFDKTNRGEIRVLMGTTEKLGVGVNVQERLIAVHHIDAPMRPMDFEQRNGRIRQNAKAHLESCYSDGKIPERKEIAQQIAVWLERSEGEINSKLEAINSLPQWQICNLNDYTKTVQLTLPGELQLTINVQGIAGADLNGFDDTTFTKGITTTYRVRGPFGIKSSSVFSGATGLLTRIENALDNEKTRPEKILKEQTQIEANLISLKHELEDPFPQEEALTGVKVRMEEVETALAQAVNEDLNIGQTQLLEDKNEAQEEADASTPDVRFTGGNGEQGGTVQRQLVAEYDGVSIVNNHDDARVRLLAATCKKMLPVDEFTGAHSSILDQLHKNTLNTSMLREACVEEEALLIPM